MPNAKHYSYFGWVGSSSIVGESITFTYKDQVITAIVRKKRGASDSSLGDAYCSFYDPGSGKRLNKCPLKLLSGLGLDGENKNRTVLYHPERNEYAFARDICRVTGLVSKNGGFNSKPSSSTGSFFYNEDAAVSYEKAFKVAYNNKHNNICDYDAQELAIEIYNSKDKNGNYRCHVSNEIMPLRQLNADHCHCTGEYIGLVTREVNTIEGQIKKILSRKGVELTHKERLDLVRGMLLGAEKMHNRKVMEIWENTVRSLAALEKEYG